MSLFQRIKTPFGEAVRERREELGLDLATIGAALRIRPAFLAALEQGRAQDLPGPAYAIGFIRAYAQYLGLDSERVLESYKAASAEIHARPDLSLPMPLGERSLPGGPALLVALILALCGYGTWYYLSTGERNRPPRVGPVPAALQQSATAAATTPAPGGGRLQPGLALPASAPAATEPSGGGAVDAPAAAAATVSAQIEIRAMADCWIQVHAADHTVVFSRVLKAGETYRVPRSGLFLRTGNAGALAIAVGGRTAPPIGRVGVLRRDVALDPAALLAGTAVRG